MKTYYNATTKEWYSEGESLTRRIDEGGVFSGVPTETQLFSWGFEVYTPPSPPSPDPTETRKMEILAELASMDYLTSKFVDGEDMSQYGDWQAKRKSLRDEYRALETESTTINLT